MLDPAAIDAALAEIDPRSRALIELFYRRNLPDSYVANLLGLDQDGLADSRADAEEELAGVLDADLEDLIDALPGLAEAEEGAEAAEVEPEPAHDEPESEQPTADEEAVADEEVTAERDAVAEDDSASSRGIARWVGALAGGIAIAVIVVVVLAANGKDSKTAGTESKTTTTTKTTAQPKKKSAPKPVPRTFPVVTFQRLNGTNGKGTVQLVEDGGETRLHVRVRDFLTPQGGGYAIWLYNSDTDARQLQATTNTTFDVTLGLPADYKKFQFVDVSREPDTLPAHSNISLLRAPMADLDAK